MAGTQILKHELMKDITNSFRSYFYPTTALVFYQNDGALNETYVEHFDMEDGKPVNPHPLSAEEAKRLATALQVDEDKINLLKSDGILQNNILSFDAKKSAIIWHTKSQLKQLHFSDGLGIKSGKANVPTLVWKADKDSLQIFALASNRKPTPNSDLYYAPFFNIYQDGSVCMGTVSINTYETGSVKELMSLWENYFFNSYFSHLMADHNPVDGNCVLLWESLIDTDKLFPTDMLIKTNKKLKDVLL